MKFYMMCYYLIKLSVNKVLIVIKFWLVWLYIIYVVIYIYMNINEKKYGIKN